MDKEKRYCGEYLGSRSEVTVGGIVELWVEESTDPKYIEVYSIENIVNKDESLRLYLRGKDVTKK